MAASSLLGTTSQGSGSMPDAIRTGTAPWRSSSAPTHLEMICQPSASAVESASSPAELGELLRSAWHRPIKSLEIVVRGFEIPACATRLAESLQDLQSLTFTSVGDVADVKPDFQLCDGLKRRGWQINFDFMLDDRADAFAALANLPTSMTAVLKLSSELREHGASVRWLVPLSPALIGRLEGLFSSALDAGVQPILVCGELAEVTSSGSRNALTADERLFGWDFITYRLLEEEPASRSPAHRRYYEDLRDSLTDDASLGTQDTQTIAVLRSAGDESEDRWTLQADERPASRCRPLIMPAADDSGGTPGQRRPGEPIAEVGGVLLQGLRGLAQWGAAQVTAPFRQQRATPDKLPRVVLIGAYGGEHIGDTAILGGVLRRIHERYGVRHATLMSQRATHTRHLVKMLDTPVQVEVATYEHAYISAEVKRADAVVFAGGPLMDLPKQLVLHLYCASMARRRGKPFIVEGIGSGPFLRLPSAFVGRRLVKMASRVSVRTTDDGKHSLVRGLDLDVGRDPAFDYLETRGVPLTRVPEHDRAWVRNLLSETVGRPLIGMNVRPIRHDYTEGTAGQDPAVYTRMVESRFEQRMADGLLRFHDCLSAQEKPCFVFFPMNAIQFGMSDLRSAFRIQRLLKDKVDFRVWQSDASLDGVVDLLRRMDVVITMRFHATIFALSQERPVIGIDYRIGKRDKVAALLSDFHQSENCVRVDEMTADWLAQRLAELAKTKCVERDGQRERIE